VDKTFIFAVLKWWLLQRRQTEAYFILQLLEFFGLSFGKWHYHWLLAFSTACLLYKLLTKIPFQLVLVYLP